MGVGEVATVGFHLSTQHRIPWSEADQEAVDGWERMWNLKMGVETLINLLLIV